MVELALGFSSDITEGIEGIVRRVDGADEGGRISAFPRAE